MNASPQRAQWVREGREGSDAIDHPDNAIAHARYMEIQQVTEPEPAETEITEELSAMNRQDRL
jgi:hypothetical protein